MLTKSHIWVAVLNGSKARIFYNNGLSKHIELVKECTSDTAHMRSSELGRDKPGRVFESANTARHSVEPKTDLHNKDKIQFAQQIASILNQASALGKFNNLILISSPEFLGEIRTKLSKSTYALVIKELKKDLTHLAEKDILNYIF
jgi:protein required for attachment to host cells